MSDAPGTPAAGRSRSLQLVAIVVLTVLVPFSIRLSRVGSAEAEARLQYLPVFPGQRAVAFHAHRLTELQHGNPAVVVIGDSMAGTRVNERLLAQLSGVGVASLLQAGSGSAFWYLAMKNWVIASGIKPRVVFIFFRDTNLTDVMFRLDEQYRWSLGMVASEREDELNAIIEQDARGPFNALHRAAERAYGVDAARRRLEPILTRGPVAWVTRPPDRQASLLAYANERFGLDHLRVMEAADMASETAADFNAAVSHSVLPLMVRDAQRAGFKLCFVRVQRRPVGGQPPAQSPALRRYIQDLRRYVQARGAILHDDTGDPAMTLDMYEDGDHIARHARDRYTRMLYERLRMLFRPAAPRPGAPAPR